MDSRLAYLLKQYLERKISEAEKEEFFSYVRREDTREFFKDVIGEELEREVSFASVGEENEIPVARSIRWGRRWYLASIGAAAVVIFILFWNVNRENVRPEATVSVVKNAGETRVVFKKNELIELPDGSGVMLKENSELTAIYQNGVFTREVLLNGEAFFEIQHHNDVPFVVKAGEIKTTVLGTAFNIRSLGHETEVTVTRGLVEVSGSGKTYGKLSAREKLIVSAEAARFQTLTAEETSLLSLDLLPLIFEEVSLSDVTRRLSEKFDTSVVIENKDVAKCRLTASFTHGENLNDILDLICQMRHATYVSEEGKVRIVGGKSCM